MNGRIMLGVGAAVMVWGAVALAYEQGATGAALLVAGLVILVLGLRQSRRER